MDWRKSKQILLVALILLNLLLYGGIVKKRSREASASFSEKTAILTEALAENDIVLSAKIPHQPKNTYALEVGYQEYDLKEFNGQYFHNRGEVTNQGTGFMELTYGNEVLTTTYGRLLEYQAPKLRSGEVFGRDQVVEEVVAPFLKEMDISMEDMVLIYANPIEEDQGWYLEFGKTYKGVPLEKSRTTIQTCYGRVFYMKRLWLEVCGESEANLASPDPIKELFSLVGRSEYRGKTIVDVELCHYFDPEHSFYVDNVYSVSTGRALPAWCITFEDQSRLMLGTEE